MLRPTARTGMRTERITDLRVQERFVPQSLTWIENTFFSATNGLKVIPAAFIARMQRLKRT